MKYWIYNPKAREVPVELKFKIERRATDLINSDLKKKHLKEKPKNNNWNYLVDIYYKWIGNRFYLCSKYICHSPQAISPSFESKFARLEYIGDSKFQLFFRRHTGQWIKLYEDISIKEAFKSLKENPWFTP